MTSLRSITGSCSQLSAEEERALFDRMASGDQTAVETLFRSIAYFIFGEINQRKLPTHLKEDRESDACLAFMKCIASWTPDKGRLLTYFKWWMLAETGRGRMLDRLIHIPIPVQEGKHVKNDYSLYATRSKNVQRGGYDRVRCHHDPVREAMKREDRQLLARLLRQVPKGNRAVIIKMDLKGLSCRDVACGRMSRHAVHCRRKTAIQVMKQCLLPAT